MVCYGIFLSGQYQNIGRVLLVTGSQILVVSIPVQNTCARFNLVPRVSQRGCARLCTRGVCTGSSKSKWRVSEKGKMRCNNDIKHVVEKLRIEISNRNIDELRERAC